MDLGGISSYTDYLTKQSTASAKLNDTLTNTDYSNADEDKLLSVCKEFEAYFLEQVFKEMQKTVDIFSDDEDGYASQMVDYFKDSVIQQISEQTATQGSNSLAQMLYEQAKINYGIV